MNHARPIGPRPTDRTLRAPFTAPTAETSKPGDLRWPEPPTQARAARSAPQGPVAAALARLRVGRAAQTTVTGVCLGAALLTAGCGGGALVHEAPVEPAAIHAPAPETPAVARFLPGGVPVKLAPSEATPAEAYHHYATLIRAAGGKVGATHVLALRGLTRDAGAPVETRADYAMRDTIVVLRDGAALELPGSTYPGHGDPGKGPDVTGDGVSDVGMVREGHYIASDNGAFIGAPSYHVKTKAHSGRVPGVRDTNQDGVFSPEEWVKSVEAGHTLGDVLFHIGFEDDTRDRPLVNSRGCFNVYPIADFVAAVGGPHARFDVTIVNAHAPEPGSGLR